MSSMHVCNIIIISPLKMVLSFIWVTFNPLHQRRLCAKFDLNWYWPSGSWKEYMIVKIFNFRQCIFAICPLLNKLESPLPREAFCEVCFKSPVLLQRKLFEFRQYIFAIWLLSTLWKVSGPFWTNLNTL